MILINQRSKTPLYEQIYRQIQEGISEGIYPPESKLPSIRALANDIQCSRNTVEAAYRLLMQEGFIQSRPGSGFTVQTRSADGRDFRDYHDHGTYEAGNDIASEKTLLFDDIEDSDNLPGLAKAEYDFTYGNLQQGTFPALDWKSITDDVLLSVDAVKADAYTNSPGELSLRREIARMLAQTRNIRCSPEQIIVQGGTQASLANLLMLFDPNHDVIAMEDPGYDGARSVFERRRFPIVACHVNRDPEEVLRSYWESGAKLAYTTPSNQFPMGFFMPQNVRLDLIEWAFETDAYIIEDDYCSEFNYRNQPAPSMQSLDKRGRVIYMGTFSKSLSPALRMNYLVLPPDLLTLWREAFSNAYPAVSWLSQEVLARYLADSHSERRLRRLQVAYRRKYELLTSALRETMGDKVDIIEGGAGLHLLVNVRDGRGQGELIALAREKGVRVYETDRYWMEEDHPLNGCVLVGFSAIPDDCIEPGVRALAEAWFG